MAADESRTGRSFLARFVDRQHSVIAVVATGGIVLYLLLKFAFRFDNHSAAKPLLFALIIGGIPLVLELIVKMIRREFGSDLLAGLAIVTSVLLHQYLAGTIVVLMLSGGEALERYAVQNASSVLRAMAKRMPSVAHLKQDGEVTDIPAEKIRIDDRLVIFPHDICPVDGVVIEGHGNMDESFLTGEPFQISKAPGSIVISGALNGETAMIIKATKLPVDSRYAKIMKVVREAEQNRPRIRRIGDQLGAFYTPLALGIAAVAWLFSGDATRFLSVLVVATPCPLLLAIPISVIGSISLAARRSIVVKNPAAMEQIESCRTAIFDKTGTLTYGEPQLTEQLLAPGISADTVLSLAASLEHYSKHPLAKAILAAADKHALRRKHVEQLAEPPGEGLSGTVDGKRIQVTSRKKALAQQAVSVELIPPQSTGLECVILLDDRYAATYRFHDTPRAEGRSFVAHLRPRHRFDKIMIVSGDRDSEVRYLAQQMGISEIHADKHPEEKLEIVRTEAGKQKTVYVGDGINDAPSMMAATVGVAIGQNSDVTSEAADVVVMEGSLKRVDEFMHISSRMRTIALQSAVGGMVLSAGGMLFAATGMLPPVAGAITQEAIDVLAILNALRAAWPPQRMTDF